MPAIPESVIRDFAPGLDILRRGKVRDTFKLEDPNLLLVLATDRISIFDIVLNALVPNKGEILNAMNIFWRLKVLGELFPHDLIAYGNSIDKFLPKELQGNVELMKRAVVVRRMEMLDFEAIVRGYLTGSGWKDYKRDGMVGGHKLPQGLHDGSQLPFPIFTPSTKAREGHDVNITADEVSEHHGARPERLALQIYALAAEYARQRGIIIADTKFEFSNNIIGDEVLTPDSSRFWDVKNWEQAQSGQKSAQSFDKQFVRDWGKTHGLNDSNEGLESCTLRAQSLEVPEDVIKRTTQLYRFIFWRLTGMRLEHFQQDEMNIPVDIQPRRIRVIVGSKSDLPQCLNGFRQLQKLTEKGDVNCQTDIISCHRNPDELRQEITAADCDVIIAGAGLAAALPGMVKSLLRKAGKNDIPVLGVGFEGGTEKQNLAAQLSIEELPGAPVELNPRTGKAYFGSKGFTEACHDAVYAEFLPRKAKTKPPELNIQI